MTSLRRCPSTRATGAALLEAGRATMLPSVYREELGAIGRLVRTSRFSRAWKVLGESVPAERVVPRSLEPSHSGPPTSRTTEALRYSRAPRTFQEALGQSSGRPGDRRNDAHSAVHGHAVSHQRASSPSDSISGSSTAGQHWPRGGRHHSVRKHRTHCGCRRVGCARWRRGCREDHDGQRRRGELSRRRRGALRRYGDAFGIRADEVGAVRPRRRDRECIDPHSVDVCGAGGGSPGTGTKSTVSHRWRHAFRVCPRHRATRRR